MDDIHLFLQHGNVPLHEAASSGRSLCIAKLLANGAHVDVVNEVWLYIEIVATPQVRRELNPGGQSSSSYV